MHVPQQPNSCDNSTWSMTDISMAVTESPDLRSVCSVNATVSVPLLAHKGRTSHKAQRFAARLRPLGRAGVALAGMLTLRIESSIMCSAPLLHCQGCYSDTTCYCHARGIKDSPGASHWTVPYWSTWHTGWDSPWALNSVLSVRPRRRWHLLTSPPEHGTTSTARPVVSRCAKAAARCRRRFPTWPCSMLIAHAACPMLLP